MSTEIMKFEHKELDQFTSFIPDSMEERKLLVNAMNNPTGKVSDLINMPISITDVVIERVWLKDTKVQEDANMPFKYEDEGDDSTGKMREAYRVILITDEGKSYNCTSVGIYNSVKAIMNVFGTLHFQPGLPVVVRQRQVKRGSALTLELQ